MALALVLLIAGLAVLAVAADQFVVGAARVAHAARVSSLVVGVVVVGFGTSLPEALVSALAAGRGELAVAVGNIVGSNVANLSLLLAVGALIAPLAVASSVVRREVPWMLAATVAISLVVQGSYSRLEGAFLLAAMIGLVVWSVVDARRSRPDDPLAAETDEFLEDGAPRLGREVGRTVLGLAGTLAASQAVLTGALRLADELGLAAGFVGATIVALGTSLPELVTVVQSARRAEPDLIVGNLVGSNLFNALGVGGLAGIVGNGVVADPAVTTRAVIAMLVVTGLAAAALVSGRRVTRGEAVVLLVAYVTTVVVVGV